MEYKNSICDLCLLDEHSPLFVAETPTLRLFINENQQEWEIGSIAVMIVTKRHVSTFHELTSKEWRECYPLFQMYLPRHQDLNLLLNVGEYAGQTQHHVHFHGFARVKGDKIENMKRPFREKISSEQIVEVKKYIVSQSLKKWY